MKSHNRKTFWSSSFVQSVIKGWEKFFLTCFNIKGENMKTLKLAFALIILFLLGGCANEAYNPVDQGTSFEKAEPNLAKILLVPFDKKEPNASGLLTYVKPVPKNFTFKGTNLLPDTYYAICYGDQIIAVGKTNGGGNINLSGSIKFDIFTYHAQFYVWYAESFGGLRNPEAMYGKVLVEKTPVPESAN